MRTILFEVEGGSTVGMGHVFRSLTLAQHLRVERGCRILFDASGDAISMGVISRKGFPLADGGELADVRVIDVPAASGRTRLERKSAKKTVALDFFDYRRPLPDAVVNLFNHADTRPPPGTTEYFEGFGFAIVREDLWQYRSAERAVPPRRLLVMLGGSDPMRNTERVVRALRRGSPMEDVDVIVGPAFSRRQDVRQHADDARTKIHEDPEHLRELMGSADLAICSGGTTMLELLYLGVPSIVIPSSELEHRFAREAETTGAIVLLPTAPPEELIRDRLEELRGSPDQLRAVSRRARALVDGCGVVRIGNIILT